MRLVPQVRVRCMPILCCKKAWWSDREQEILMKYTVLIVDDEKLIARNIAGSIEQINPSFLVFEPCKKVHYHIGSSCIPVFLPDT